MKFDQSYIDLCRELRLEREFEVGDWFAEDDNSVFMSAQEDVWPRTTTEHFVWLPRLDQLFAMLEETGETCIAFAPSRKHPGWVRAFVPSSFEDDPVRDEAASTREEAVARLWMAVTGR